MENKMEMKELNQNDMSCVAGGSNAGMTDANKGAFQFLRDVAVGIYRKLFIPTKTLD